MSVLWQGFCNSELGQTSSVDNIHCHVITMIIALQSTMSNIHSTCSSTSTRMNGSYIIGYYAIISLMMQLPYTVKDRRWCGEYRQ